MQNPLYKSNDSPNSVTQPSKSVNEQGVHIKRTHNTFDYSYFFYTTERFGTYEPFFIAEGVPRDILPLTNSHNVRTLPMVSPFVGQLDKHKDYFLVPNDAIQPNTFNYIYTQPSQGDDVPADAHNLWPCYAYLPQKYVSLYELLLGRLIDWDSNPQRLITFLIAENFFSHGCLLNKLGYKLNPIFYNSESPNIPYSFDNFFDYAMRSLESLSFSVDDNSYSYSIEDDGNILLHEALSLLRRFGSRVSQLECSFADDPNVWSFVVSSLPNREVGINNSIDINRVCSYQLACAQFYVNPKVDFLYNAQLFRDNTFTLLNRFNPNVHLSTFMYNGINIPYDYFSQKYYQQFVDYFCGQIDSLDASALLLAYDYINAIFGYRETLRFGDYFTDCRTRPLALGEDMVGVSAEGVSVIDMSQSIVFQRYRNAVVKIGQNYGDYLREIIGSEPAPDYHVPKFIAHVENSISGFEVANTADVSRQGNLVTNLRTADENVAFEISIDMPCIVIGISSYSCPRVYSQTKDRFFFHKDRYDMFNPMLQYLGDQAVYNNERTDLRPDSEVFGYQSRHNEYKQRYSHASGGFVSYLPSWTFITDSLFNPVVDITLVDHQSPDFIRAHDFEFNRFFKQLSGYSLASAFHFIVVYNNKCMFTRPMEVNPQIL